MDKGTRKHHNQYKFPYWSPGSLTTSALKQARIDERNSIIEKMRAKGMTEEQIKEILS